jgi:hypothetical protein
MENRNIYSTERLDKLFIFYFNNFNEFMNKYKSTFLLLQSVFQYVH